MRRMDWYPIRLDGSRPDAGDWVYFGQFLGEMAPSTFGMGCRYLSAGVSGPPKDLGGATIPAL